MTSHRLRRSYLFLSITLIFFLLITACGKRVTLEPILVSNTALAPKTLTFHPAATASQTQNLPTPIKGVYATRVTGETLEALWKAKTASPTLTPFTPVSGSLDTPVPPVATPLARENTPVPQSGVLIKPDNASQVVELVRWGKGSVKDIAYSPDGEVLAVATSLGIYFYNNQSSLLRFIEIDQPVERVAFSPRDNLMAVGSNQGRVQLLNWKENRLIKTVQAELQQRIQHLTFSPDGDLIGYSIITDYPIGQATVVKVSDNTPIFRTNVTVPGTLQFAPDGQSLYTANGLIQKYRLSDGKVQASWALPNPEDWEAVNNMTLSSDEMIMVVSTNVRVYLWNLKDPAPFYSFEATDDIYNGHEYYRADTCYFTVSGGGDRYFHYAISPDNQRLVVLGGNGSFEIRRLRDGAIIATSPEKTKHGQAEIFVHGAVFHPNRPEFAVHYSPGPIEIVNLDSMAVKGTITGHIEQYSALSFSPPNPNERAYLAAGASDQITRIWNVQNGQRAMDLDAQALSVAFSSNGKYLAWGSKDWSYTLLNIINGKKIGPIHAHQDWVSDIVFSADQKMLITGSYDCTVKVWEINDGISNGDVISLKTTLGGTERNAIGRVNQLVLSGDGNWVIGGSSWNVFRYNLKTQKFDSNTKISGTGVAIAPDSRTFAVSGGNGLSIWNIETLEKVAEWPIVAAGQIAYSPDGLLIAIGTYEGLIQLVVGQTGQVRNTLKGHEGEINDLKFSQDGHFLASAARDGTVRVWGVP